jgi:hypothetical protein
VSRSSRIKVEKKFLGGSDIYPLFLDISGRERTYPVQTRTCPLDSSSAAKFDDCFERNFLTISPIDLILLLLAFIILLESRFCYWKMLSSPSSIEVVRGFDFGT